MNRFRNKIHKLSVSMICLLLTLAIFQPKDVSAHSIHPYIKDYLVYQGEKIDDSFIFTNTSDKKLEFNLYVTPYDPQNGMFIDDEIFIKSAKDKIIVEPKKSVEIKYTLTIPSFHDEGSYFNVVVVEEVIDERNETVGFKAGYGMLAGIHIIEENSSINGIFNVLSDLRLSLKEKGLPYISKTIIGYEYANNSGFVFEPKGEVRIFDTVTNERLYIGKLNNESQKVYPKGKYETTISQNLWNIRNLFHDLKVVTRTYNQFNSTYIETITIIPGFSVLPFILGGLAVAFGVTALVLKIKNRTKENIL